MRTLLTIRAPQLDCGLAFDSEGYVPCIATPNTGETWKYVDTTYASLYRHGYSYHTGSYYLVILVAISQHPAITHASLFGNPKSLGHQVRVGSLNLKPYVQTLRHEAYDEAGGALCERYGEVAGLCSDRGRR